MLLSHHHGDHFDRIAAEGLDKDVRGESRLDITSMPGKHAPQPLGALLPPVMGSLVELSIGGEPSYRISITGDTLLHDRLEEIPRRYPDIDLCLIHLGETRVDGILLTMAGRQGVAALNVVRPKTAVPIHYDDSTVFKSPLDDFRREVADAGTSMATTVEYVDRGETYRFGADGWRT